MVEINKLSFKYTSTADRLLITVSGTGACAALLLTRRLAIQWLKTLAQWLETGAEGRQDLEVAHGRALGRLQRAAADAPSEDREAAAASAGEPVLVSRMQFTHSRQSFRIEFYTGKNADGIAGGAFGRAAAHGLLDRLARAMGRAGWGDPLPVPEWSRSASQEKRPAGGKGTLH